MPVQKEAGFMKVTIVVEVKQMIDEKRANNNMRAMSDNCSGSPDFVKAVANEN
jgi:hypothetical protein